MKLNFALTVLISVLAIGLASGLTGSTQGTPGSGLLYSNGRVTMYQNPSAFSGSGVYQARTGLHPAPAYNPFPMKNTAATGRNGGYSSYIYLNDQLAYDFYSNPNLLKPRYITNNQRFLGAYPYTYGVIGPARNRDLRVPLLDVSKSEANTYRNQMGFLTRTSQYERQY